MVGQKYTPLVSSLLTTKVLEGRFPRRLNVFLGSERRNCLIQEQSLRRRVVDTENVTNIYRNKDSTLYRLSLLRPDSLVILVGGEDSCRSEVRV